MDYLVQSEFFYLFSPHWGILLWICSSRYKVVPPLFNKKNKKKRLHECHFLAIIQKEHEISLVQQILKLETWVPLAFCPWVPEWVCGLRLVKWVSSRSKRQTSDISELKFSVPYTQGLTAHYVWKVLLEPIGKLSYWWGSVYFFLFNLPEKEILSPSSSWPWLELTGRLESLWVWAGV